MEKEDYEPVKMEVILFEEEDVITTSGDDNNLPWDTEVD